MENGHWKPDTLWRARLYDAKTDWMESFLSLNWKGFPFSCWGTKNNDNNDKWLGKPGGEKQGHWPKHSSSSPRTKCSTASLTGCSCCNQPPLGLTLTSWTCLFTSLAVMVLGRTTGVCGALCVSSRKFVVGAVLYGDWHLSTPLIFSEYLRKKTLGISLTSKYGCGDYWLNLWNLGN